jgi:hypothetical protein
VWGFSKSILGPADFWLRPLQGEPPKQKRGKQRAGCDLESCLKADGMHIDFRKMNAKASHAL